MSHSQNNPRRASGDRAPEQERGAVGLHRIVLPILGACEAPKQGQETAPGQKLAWTHARGVTGSLNQRGGAVAAMVASGLQVSRPQNRQNTEVRRGGETRNNNPTGDSPSPAVIG